MRSLVRVGLVATLALAPLSACDENEGPAPEHDRRDVPGLGNWGPERPLPGQLPNGGGPHLPESDPDDPDDDDLLDEDLLDEDEDAGVHEDEELDDDWLDDEDELDAPTYDGGVRPAPAPAPGETPRVPTQGGTPRTEVPDELVGAWENGYVDFEFWENYREGHWAGRNALPTREAMILRKDGSAKFYRYEFLFTFYEELIDCEGTVTFNGDGTFTFYPVSGRRRFYDTAHRGARNSDRPLTAEELVDPQLAGKRQYAYMPSSEPPAIRITVPTSAPYNWYKKQ